MERDERDMCVCERREIRARYLYIYIYIYERMREREGKVFAFLPLWLVVCADI